MLKCGQLVLDRCLTDIHSDITAFCAAACCTKCSLATTKQPSAEIQVCTNTNTSLLLTVTVQSSCSPEQNSAAHVTAMPVSVMTHTHTHTPQLPYHQTCKHIYVLCLCIVCTYSQIKFQERTDFLLRL
jgi:hypothetical protein